MKNKSRYLICACILAACFCAALDVFALLPPRPGVTKANFDQIQDGMSKQEVEFLLGRPGLPFHGFADRKHVEVYVWMGDDGALVFTDFRSDCVVSKAWQPSRESILDKLRRWLHVAKTAMA